ncbi:MAG: insulinase family protein [Zoogloeaceae bacterium]|nr:insulinase family protein [Zoogloeaceae bacterium]
MSRFFFHIRFLPRLCCGSRVCLLAVAVARAGVVIERWQTPEGAQVQFVALDALPILDVQIDFRAGSAFNPQDKAGLANLTRGMLTLGAADLDETALANALADVGAALGGGADEDRASLRLRTLSQPEKQEAALTVLEKVLRQPLFDAEIFARERARSIAGLKDALTRPDTLASRAFRTALYPGHPYGRLVTPESLATLEIADVRAFWQRHYVAANAVITLVGNLSRAEAEALAARLAIAMPQGEAVPFPEPELVIAAKTVNITHPAKQAHIYLGMPAIRRGDPDFFPLLVGNYTLGGGGFVSRLMEEVREKRGFAYSVYSYFSPQRLEGPFQIGLQTQKEQAAEALRVTRAVLTDFLQTGPSAAELAAAKDNLAGSFPLRLDSNAKILENVAVIGFYGLPADYLDTYQARVRAVTQAAVKAAFARHVQPEKFVTVTVGAPQE